MTRPRIFPEPQQSDDDRVGTKKNFENTATKVFTVTKAEVDEREKQWRKSKLRKS